MCACLCAPNHTSVYILCLVPQKDLDFQVWWISSLIWLRFGIILSVLGVTTVPTKKTEAPWRASWLLAGKFEFCEKCRQDY